MPTQFIGSLQSKKKAELQEIANALSLSDSGTKEDIQLRIKKHLDVHQSTLEEDPIFSGLFGRRKRSVQPLPLPPPLSRYAAQAPLPETSSSTLKQSPSRTSTRRMTALSPTRESIIATDLRDVSTSLTDDKNFPPESESTRVSRQIRSATPTSSMPRPATPASSTIGISSLRYTINYVVDTLRCLEDAALRSAFEMFLTFRIFLSSSRNIWLLTGLFELMFILYTIIPWQIVQFSILPNKGLLPTFTLYYPPMAAFRTPAIWNVIVHWSLPTLFIPAVFSTIISFKSSLLSTTLPAHPSIQSISFDPLTASVVRLAAEIAYPYPGSDATGIMRVDVLGFRWRVWCAAIGVAFAFAEAISTAPAAFAEKYMQLSRNPSNRHLSTEKTIVVDESD